jgi:hypothetical protein
VIPSYQETIFQLIRKVVKELGKEAATHRFMLEEKKAISDIIYYLITQCIPQEQLDFSEISYN